MPSGGLWPEKISLCSEQDVSYRCVAVGQLLKLGVPSGQWLLRSENAKLNGRIGAENPPSGCGRMLPIIEK
jgi:hypothetical protein